MENIQKGLAPLQKKTLAKIKRSISPFVLFCLLSLLIHSPILLLLRDSSPPEKSWIQVEYPIHNQVVSQEKFNYLEPDKKTSYLSLASKKVEKQIQAMLRGLFHQAKINRWENFRTKNQNKRKFGKSLDKKIPVDLLEKIETGLLNLKISESERIPFFDTVKRITQPSRTIDFLIGVDFGSHTLLDTREFIYYSYINRMNRSIYWSWIEYFQPEKDFLAPEMLKGRKLFSTSLHVALSSEGELMDLKLTRASGLKDMDSAALYAILEAAPFPNPPQGLVEENGYIHVRYVFRLHVTPIHNKSQPPIRRASRM